MRIRVDETPDKDSEVICHKCGYAFRKADTYEDVGNNYGECVSSSGCARRVASGKHNYNLISRQTAKIIDESDVDAMMKTIKASVEGEVRQLYNSIMASDETFLLAYKAAANRNSLLKLIGRF